MLSNIKVKRKSDNFEAAENKIPAAAERGKMTEEKTAENVENVLYLGIDVGSTTVKAVVVDDKEKVLFSTYQRHMSEVRQKIISILEQAAAKFPRQKFCLSLTGSGALSLCNGLNIPFVQEVIASSLAIKKQIPDADVVVELGGEDAKLTFLTSGTDLRMNETCAGGTGAFIDQMATFLNLEVDEMDRLALQYKNIYPIASRCGVFAKTDIVPLINEGCAKSDIAMSIMQAVVNQFISGLARGRKIEGKVVFLGGPLAFIKSLRQCFTETLKLDAAHAVLPERAELFVAYGAALNALSGRGKAVALADVAGGLKALEAENDIRQLPPLFKNEKEKAEFDARHRQTNIKSFPLEEYEGDAWFGIDSGSTTVKAVLIDDQNRLLYSYYGSNNGDPFHLALNVLTQIYERAKPGLNIRAAAATGYGSALLKAGLKLDIDEVETVAHCKAATFFAPNASFVLDIGGQDIKCMKINRGIIEKIGLNEACSSGCGSFIENFAKSLDMDMASFVDAALKARHPVDLGTRCTVFMNSKVKQAQKEGVSVGDIAAGLSYSVIKNACYKVIKINDVAELGDCIVAQGGSFLNDALLRALEIQVGRQVVRPGLAGLMGAFGAALLAKMRGPENGRQTELITLEEIRNLKIKTTNTRCQGCTNHCMLTITDFGGKKKFVSGNKCERGAGLAKNDKINLCAYKYKRLFEYYTPLEKDRAPHGTIGIPRVLNMFEDYPLWFTLLTHLGFRVELSAPSSKKMFFSGYASIPSQTVCYPAKMAHGHIMDLIEKNVDYIFLPCIPREQKEFSTQADSYNCPVVTGYPEVLAKNIGEAAEKGIPFLTPFLPLEPKSLVRRLKDIPLFAGFSHIALKMAVNRAFVELRRFKKDIRDAGIKAVEQLNKNGEYGIVLAGHPYHIDPAVNHGIPELINSCGLSVLTEDSVAHLRPNPGALRVRDQWTYHSRLYRAGTFAADTENLAILQLVSFGCGVDAITSDQLEEIVNAKGRLYAQIKIDEGDNLGPAKIRIRSLLAALKDMQLTRRREEPVRTAKPPVFTAEMKKTHTILIPQLSPMHFQFLKTVFASEGYKVEQLPKVSKAAIELGLKHVNNDACFPAIVVIGQLLQAIKDGNYDTDKIALLISQTNGGCRASNYAGLLRRALQQCHLGHIPVIAMNVSGNVDSPGFVPGRRVLLRTIMAGCYGDALMRMVNRLTPYEKEKGSVRKLKAKWVKIIKKNLKSGNAVMFDINMFRMIREFDRLPLKDIARKPRVGLVGEILLKYHPDANNQAARLVEKEGGEAVVPDLMDFMLYGFYDHIFNYKYLQGSWKAYAISILSIGFLEFCRWSMRLGFLFSRRFEPPLFFKNLRKKIRGLVSLGHQTGEGWLLTAEIIELLESGVNNVLCMQPFGCLPNHITGKGFIREIKKRFPEANIIAVDYDPGASETNQVNRIKLMMSVSRQNAAAQKAAE